MYLIDLCDVTTSVEHRSCVVTHRDERNSAVLFAVGVVGLVFIAKIVVRAIAMHAVCRLLAAAEEDLGRLVRRDEPDRLDTRALV